MNPYTEGLTNGDGNKGGWEYSDMRAYLNSKKYLEGETAEIDYTLSGIFNALSSDLKNIIINTKVISGYFSRDSVNYVTTDKLYLLDSKEIYGSSFAETQNRAKDQERQLDFYLSKNVTTSSYSEAIKKDLGGLASYWWLRSARSHVFGCFFTVVIFGGSDFNSSSYNYGVSPAFRIAE
ncbi:MAG: hypothetical protein IJG68_00315 [Bacilli bacterium]|nr:hypothetical protein [Bacilli bacterium]